jgi:alpha-L-fucosidase 2
MRSIIPSIIKNLLCLLVVGVILSSCARSPIKVACIGDSITEGTVLEREVRYGYPEVLDSLLGPGYNVLNCGRTTTTVLRGGNEPYWFHNEFHNVFVFQPDIITIMLGTNDTKPFNWDAAAFERDYQSLIDTLQTIPGHPMIYICLPVPVFRTRWGINDSTLTSGVIPTAKEIASRNDLPIIDLYNPLLPYPHYFPDAVHPNEQGSAEIARLIAEALSPKK